MVVIYIHSCFDELFPAQIYNFWWNCNVKKSILDLQRDWWRKVYTPLKGEGEE